MVPAGRSELHIYCCLTTLVKIIQAEEDSFDINKMQQRLRSSSFKIIEIELLFLWSFNSPVNGSYRAHSSHVG